MITLRLYGLIFGLAVVAVIIFITLFTETCNTDVVKVEYISCDPPGTYEETRGEEALKCTVKIIPTCTNIWQSLFE